MRSLAKIFNTKEYYREVIKIIAIESVYGRLLNYSMENIDCFIGFLVDYDILLQRVLINPVTRNIIFSWDISNVSIGIELCDYYVKISYVNDRIIHAVRKSEVAFYDNLEKLLPILKGGALIARTY